eukprot:NODE_26_length_35450_cov_0.398320.p27 type:complete len:112 gc:universal NODE_26_length_35450_cov_0.398320:16855-17190(+)
MLSAIEIIWVIINNTNASTVAALLFLITANNPMIPPTTIQVPWPKLPNTKSIIPNTKDKKNNIPNPTLTPQQQHLGSFVLVVMYHPFPTIVKNKLFLNSKLEPFLLILGMT